MYHTKDDVYKLASYISGIIKFFDGVIYIMTYRDCETTSKF